MLLEMILKKRNNINIMKIGILIPITSKNRNWRTIKESYIYNIFLKSFLTTYCQQYEYTIYLGFDDDDKIFSKIKEQKTLLTFVSIMKNVGLKFIPMGNINKGHLTKMWTKLMNIAYDENCNYIERHCEKCISVCSSCGGWLCKDCNNKFHYCNIIAE